MEILSWIIANWGVIATPFIGVITWLAARKKNNLDLKSKDLSNIAQEFQIYKTVLKDTTEGFKEIIESRNKELEVMRKQNADLKILVKDLSLKVDKLTRQLREFENKK